MSGTGIEELTLDRDSSAAQWVIAPLVRASARRPCPSGSPCHGVFTWALIAFGVGALLLLACVELLLRLRRGPRAPSPAERIAAYVPGDVRRGATAAKGKHQAQRTALAVVLVLSLAGCDYEDLLPAKQPVGRAGDDEGRTDPGRAARAPRVVRRPAAHRHRGGATSALPHRQVAPRRSRAGPGERSLRHPRRQADQARSPLGADARRRRGLLRSLRLLPDVVARRLDGGPRDPRRPVHQGLGAGALAATGRQHDSRATCPSPADPAACPHATRRRRRPPRGATTSGRASRDDRLTLDPASKAWRDNIADLGSRAMFRGYTVAVEAGERSRGSSRSTTERSRSWRCG